MDQVNIGLAGAGTIGSGVIKLLHKHKSAIQKKTGVKLNLVRVVDRNAKVLDGLPVDKKIFSSNLDDLMKDDIDIVIELIGGTTIAKKLILNAIKTKKQIVTANKALLAEYFDLIFSEVDRNKVNLGFEASVAGGIPIIKAIKESFITNPIKTIYGILNGTSNYILTRMTESNIDFNVALKGAQEKGFAEADPTLDIEGIDAAHKILILFNLAFQQNLKFKSIPVRGIKNFDVVDIQYANELGYVIKLLAVAKQVKNSTEIFVEPSLVAKEHLLASVNHEFNAVYVDGLSTGETVFYGKGAGSLPTANAVLSDIVDVAKSLKWGLQDSWFKNLSAPSADINKTIKNKYYFRFQTIDKPGVLGRITSILGKHNISISSCVQKEVKQKNVPVVITTEASYKKDVDKALKEIQNMPEIKKQIVVLGVL